MHADVLIPYEHALRTGASIGLRHHDGEVTVLEVPRWLARADHADRTVLSRVLAPVLDVGCGPGRIAAALAERGLPTLGIDIARTAVEMTQARGVTALQRDVFSRLPREGRWGTVVLLDGNIGIGGDPVALLERARQLLRPDGRVLIETHVDPTVDDAVPVRFARCAIPAGPPFPWARVGLIALRRYCGQTGYAVGEAWTTCHRTFVVAVPG